MSDLETLLRGCEVMPENGLAEKLLQNRPLKIKLGVDPTRPDLTLGHAVVLKKLKQFQDAGHHVILLIGSFTARIGDPTGADKTRPTLTREEIANNALTYISQCRLILDVQHADVVWNNHWMDSESFGKVIELAKHFTVAQLLERDDFGKRFKEKRPIGIHELLYPLAQGLDSVKLEADVEIGGSDQLFNMMVGRTLQSKLPNPRQHDPQICLTMPLLVGTDGERKMSKSLGNHIALTDSPKDMFGKTMSIPDHLVWQWWNTIFDDSVHGGGVTQENCEQSPFEFKKALATQIVREFHSEEEAVLCLDQWDAQFSNREVPDDITTVPFNTVINKPLFEVVAELFNESKSQARRLIRAGAVKLNSDKVTDEEHKLQPNTVIKTGKRRFIKVTQ